MQHPEVVPEQPSKQKAPKQLPSLRKKTITLIVVSSLFILLIEFFLSAYLANDLSISLLLNAALNTIILITFFTPLLYFTLFKRTAWPGVDNILIESQTSNPPHDSLTELPNRALMKDRIEYSIDIARREKSSFILMLLDVNRLQEVNDTLGHTGGDMVLQSLAKRLRSHFRQSDTIARIGSDEFLVLMPKVAIEQAIDMGTKVNHWLEEPFIIKDVPVSLEVTIGIAAYPDHGTEADTLMRRTDIALRNAKKQKEEISIYQETEDLHSHSRLSLISELRSSLNNDDFYLHYQPKIELATDTVCGVEALVRWQHPERGIVPPDQFMPTIENTGFIKPFTKMTLIKAIAQCRQWQTSDRPIKIAVNLSARLLLHKTLPERILTLLEQWDVSPEMLELEITESAVLANPELAGRILSQLHKAGLTLSIDDFGTGYTSLSYLSQLPINLLKIDRCFVADMLTNQRHAVITKSILELGHNLGLKVIAEGVEDEATYKALKNLGCDIAQGYYISKPLSADALENWMDERAGVSFAT